MELCNENGGERIPLMGCSRQMPFYGVSSDKEALMEKFKEFTDKNLQNTGGRYGTVGPHDKKL
ncbi:MAG: hypothetical protein WKI04_02105 [Ferruginibacter sp.]